MVTASASSQEQVEIGGLRQRLADLEQRNRELAALQSVALAGSQAGDLEELLGRALDAVLDAAGASQHRPAGGIFLIDHRAERLQLSTWRDLPWEFLQQESSLALGECLCGFVGRSGCTLLLPEDCRHPLQTRESPLGDHRSRIVAPLTARGQTLGVLFVYLAAGHTPAPSYVELVTSVGQQLGAAVAQARLYQELRAAIEQLRHANAEVTAQNARLERANRELQVTRDLAMSTQSLLDVADVQEQVLRLITGELGFERAILALTDGSGAALTGWLSSTSGSGAAPQRIPHTTRLPL